MWGRFLRSAVLSAANRIIDVFHQNFAHAGSDVPLSVNLAVLVGLHDGVPVAIALKLPCDIIKNRKKERKKRVLKIGS